MVLKCFILPKKYFKENLFFPIMTPPKPTPPLTLGTVRVGIPRGVKGSHKGEKNKLI